MNTQKNTKSVAQKPFCKVCHDAGKSESEYTSHFVRSDLGPKSKVVCPTLLNLECRFCFEKGHTVSFCSVLKKQKNALDNDLDDEVSNTQVKVKEEFPILCGVAKKAAFKPSDELSYAAKAAKAAQVIEKPVLKRAAHYKEKIEPIMVKKRWADWSDSEDDDDDEMEELEVSEGGW